MADAMGKLPTAKGKTDAAAPTSGMLHVFKLP
jgi:hypothetical protein